MTAPVEAKRGGELAGQSQWQPLAELAPYELRDKLGRGVASWRWGPDSRFFSFNNARLTVPIIGDEGVPIIEMEGPKGVSRIHQITYAVIGQCGGLVLIVPPAQVSVRDGIRETTLSWFELSSDGCMRRGEEVLEKVRELGIESPVIEAVLQAAEEAEEQASKAHQALYR